MKNRLVTQEDVGVKWLSRDVVITSLVFKIGIFGAVYVLANLRGKGCTEFINYWNLPGGFLDFNETGEEAASRETFEETGYLIPKEDFSLIETSTDPKINKQHVAFRYLAVIESKDTWNYREYEDIDKALANLTGEKDEVANISWIHIDSLNNYNWAFNHKEIILKTYKEHIKYYGSSRNN